MSAHFLSRKGGNGSESAERTHELESTLQTLFQVAQRAWPGISVTPETFVHHLAERLSREGNTLEMLREVHAADLYLACACSEGNDRALEAFDKQVLSPVVAELERGRALACYTDEIKQSLRMRLLLAKSTMLPRIHSYRGQAPLTAWVRMAAARMAYDLRRVADRSVDAEGLLMIRSKELDPELAYVKSHYVDELDAAFRSTLTLLTARERTILRFYFFDGLDSSSIATAFGVSSRTIRRWIAQIRARILNRTRRLLGQRLRISPRQLDSFIGLLQSRIDTNICKVLKDTDA